MFWGENKQVYMARYRCYRSVTDDLEEINENNFYVHSVINRQIHD